MTLKGRSQITLRLPKELEEALTQKVIKLGIPKNAYLTMLITEDLNKDKQKAS